MKLSCYCALISSRSFNFRDHSTVIYYLNVREYFSLWCSNKMFIFNKLVLMYTVY